MAADTNPDNDSTNIPAVSTAESGLAISSGSTGENPQGKLGSRLLDYSAHAAMIVGLVGFAWTVSSQVVKHPDPRPATATAHAAAAPPSQAPSKPDEMADLRRTNQQMSEDLRHLRANVESLRAAVREDKTSVQVRVLQAGLENVQNGLTAARSETAQLNGKIDKMAHEPAAKPPAPLEHVSKSDKSGVDMTTTASIPPAPAAKIVAAVVPIPPAKPAAAKATDVKLASVDEPHKLQVDPAGPDSDASKPQVIPGFVVRDVYDGVALIEGRHGSIEVVPGVGIPGAGVVKSINRKGNGWTVTTTKGLLASAAAPVRDSRRMIRAPHDFYPPYREEF